MIIPTRPLYPSDRLTLDIANTTRNKLLQFVGLQFNLIGCDISVLLEDKPRKVNKIREGFKVEKKVPVAREGGPCGKNEKK